MARCGAGAPSLRGAAWRGRAKRRGWGMSFVEPSITHRPTPQCKKSEPSDQRDYEVHDS